MNQIVNWLVQWIPGVNQPERYRHIQNLLSVILAALTFAGAAVNSYNSLTDAGSSDNKADQPKLSELVQPLDTSRLWEDTNIRNDLTNILNQSRIEAGRSIVEPNYDLSMSAQRWAERNAMTDSFKPTPDNVVMVQSSLPSADAKAARFLGGWFNDPQSQEALGKSDLRHIGVGVASANGKTFAVIQLS
ncbi:hypothetical protein CMUST_12530 [Corynebacterium mustelae]|uniref:SCP domain-containing protein n=1 Tax=Corynebacterium mustelae TaxID=571915 RepID=A0A0G3H082_9CORY|nr:CAP domain-containing protein [Corynebacterium mustelae]AKK06811.1 hypothetical protein CMUST_12530 [Corynebacterium mustelae]